MNYGMGLRQLRRARVVRAILILGFSTLSPINTVICYGSDGHAAVEPVFYGHCSAGVDGKANPQDGGPASNPGLPPDACRDVPQSLASRIDQRPTVTPGCTLQPSICPVNATDAAVPDPQREACCTPCIHPPSDSLTLRSTILLI